MPGSPNIPTCRSAASSTYLEQSGQLDNTLILYCADNGASGEGSPNGSVNENKFFNGYPDSIEDNMKLLDKLGSADTYNHYPTGWAVGVLHALPHVQALSPIMPAAPAIR